MANEQDNEEVDNMDKIMLLATKNPTIKNNLELVSTGAQDYGTALENMVIALAEQIQTLQNAYRNS